MTQKQRIVFGVAMWVVAAALLMAVSIQAPPMTKVVIICALGCSYLGGVAFMSYAERKD